jgi:hypothetical protein
MSNEIVGVCERIQALVLEMQIACQSVKDLCKDCKKELEKIESKKN